MLNIGLISCGRSDFNIYLPLMEVLMSDIDINLKVIAAGTHSKKEYGSTTIFLLHILLIYPY